MKSFKEIDARWRNHLMVLAAFRYCLGRQTYIVTECVEWLCELWDQIPVRTADLIVTETQDALDNNMAGDICDAEMWQFLLDHIDKKAASEETASTQGKTQ